MRCAYKINRKAESECSLLLPVTIMKGPSIIGRSIGMEKGCGSEENKKWATS